MFLCGLLSLTPFISAESLGYSWKGEPVVIAEHNKSIHMWSINSQKLETDTLYAKDTLYVTTDSRFDLAEGLINNNRKLGSLFYSKDANPVILKNLKKQEEARDYFIHHINHSQDGSKYLGNTVKAIIDPKFPKMFDNLYESYEVYPGTIDLENKEPDSKIHYREGWLKGRFRTKSNTFDLYYEDKISWVERDEQLREQWER